MTTHPFRTLAGAAALAAGLGVLSATAAPPAAAYKKAAAADVEFLQKALAGGKAEKRAIPTLKAVAVMLAAYGEKTGDAALAGAATKVAEALGKKDLAGADAAAKALSSPSGSGTAAAAAAAGKVELSDVMAVFRKSKVGGLNIEDDVRTGKKGVTDAKAAEVLGLRTAILADLTAKMPAEKAAAGANKAEWEKWSKEMGTLGQSIAEEAAKPKADTKALAKLMDKLDANCTTCHNKYRD